MVDTKSPKVSGTSLLEDRGSPIDGDFMQVGTTDSVINNNTSFVRGNTTSPHDREPNISNTSEDNRDESVSRRRSGRRLSTLSRMSELVNISSTLGSDQSRPSYETLEDSSGGSKDSVVPGRVSPKYIDTNTHTHTHRRAHTHISSNADQININTSGNPQPSGTEVKSINVPIAREGSFFKRAKLVYQTRQISGRDYNVLSRWFLLVSGVINGLIFGFLCFMATDERTYYGTPADKLCIIIVSTLGVMIVLMYACVLLGYCLMHKDHPLIRARGNVYITILLISTVCAAINTWMVLQRGSGIFGQHRAWYTVNATTRVAAVMGLLGSMVARQRLVYILFVLHAMDANPPRYVNAKTYLWICLWIACISVPIAVLIGLDMHRYDRATSLLACAGYLSLLVVLAYYTYLCRHVTQAFSDWRTNLFVGVIVTLAAVGIIISQHTVFKKVDGEKLAEVPGGTLYSVPESVNLVELYFRGFLTFWTLSVVVLQLFAGVTAIVFFDISLCQDLDPKSVYELSKNKAAPTNNYGPDRSAAGFAHVTNTLNITDSGAINVRSGSAINFGGGSSSTVVTPSTKV